MVPVMDLQPESMGDQRLTKYSKRDSCNFPQGVLV